MKSKKMKVIAMRLDSVKYDKREAPNAKAFQIVKSKWFFQDN